MHGLHFPACSPITEAAALAIHIDEQMAPSLTSKAPLKAPKNVLPQPVESRTLVK